jgi:hypothetical protein
MFPDFNFLDFVIIILLGFILGVKRVAEMERYHTLRVVILAVVLSFIAGFLFLAFALSINPPFQYDCVDSDGHFTCTEM